MQVLMAATYPLEVVEAQRWLQDPAHAALKDGTPAPDFSVPASLGGKVFTFSLADALKKGHVIVVVRRDGTRATGIRALAMVARCVPLLFPLWAPLAFVASLTERGEASPRV